MAALVPASYVVLLRSRAEDDRQEVLLHLRRGTGCMDGHWGLPAGHVEDEEAATAAAARELEEEVGVVVEAAGLHHLTTMHRTRRGGGAREQRVDFFFLATTWTGDPRVVEPAKNAAVVWFALDALPVPVVPHEAVVLGHLARREPVPTLVEVGF